MNVLVDTPVWSLAFRRRSHDLSAEEARLKHVLTDLVSDGRIAIIGLIRQEVLSGIREPEQFIKIRDLLRAFIDIPLHTADFERAAQMSNDCRSHGVANTTVDMLICSIAAVRKCVVFTTDRDFELYSKLLPVRLFRPQGV
jgi:predicted nucleic acid-binding protein